MEDCMGALQDEADKGRTRAFGLSNETAWGTMQWLGAVARTSGPRPVSIQNKYSLMCRAFGRAQPERGYRLASFLAACQGSLDGQVPEGGHPRGRSPDPNPRFGLAQTDRALDAVDRYMQIARRHGLDHNAKCAGLVHDAPLHDLRHSWRHIC